MESSLTCPVPGSTRTSMIVSDRLPTTWGSALPKGRLSTPSTSTVSGPSEAARDPAPTLSDHPDASSASEALFVS